MIRDHNKHLENVCDFGYFIGCVLYVLMYIAAGCAFGGIIALIFS